MVKGIYLNKASSMESVAGIVWALPLSHTTALLRAAANDTGFGWISSEWITPPVKMAYAVAFYVICHYAIKKKLY